MEREAVYVVVCVLGIVALVVLLALAVRLRGRARRLERGAATQAHVLAAEQSRLAGNAEAIRRNGTCCITIRQSVHWATAGRSSSTRWRADLAAAGFDLTVNGFELKAFKLLHDSRSRTWTRPSTRPPSSAGSCS